MIKAAVLGATGYAGIELVRLLTSHPEVSIEILGSHSFAGQKISDVYKNFNHVLEKVPPFRNTVCFIHRIK